MNIECPKCNEDHEVDGEDLPHRACDSTEFECQNPECHHKFMIGWYAEIEVRNKMLD